MKITVVGAGGIGGWVAARLALGGHDPTLLVRHDGPFEELSLVEGGEVRSITVRASANADQLGRQNLLVFAVKAFALAEAAAAAAPLIGPETTIVPMVNGVPWWFASPRLRSVDPDGEIDARLPIEQVVGSVVHAAVRRNGRDILVHHSDKIILGEPAGGMSERVTMLASLFRQSAIAAQSSADVRNAIWYKAWGNMTMNPLSALTLATADRIIAECRPLLLAAMDEARSIGAAIGCRIDERGDDRIAVTARLGAFKTSMLQDLEAGRPIELEALVGAPLELAARHGVPAPNLASLYAMTRLMAESRGLS